MCDDARGHILVAAIHPQTMRSQPPVPRTQVTGPARPLSPWNPPQAARHRAGQDV